MPPRALKSVLRPLTKCRLGILENFRSKTFCAPLLNPESKTKVVENQQENKGIGSLENQAVWLSLSHAGHLNQLAATSYDGAILYVSLPPTGDPLDRGCGHRCGVFLRCRQLGPLTPGL